MNRALLSGFVSTWLLAPVLAQSFQFMKLPAGGRPESLLQLQVGLAGYIAGDDLDGNGYVDLLVTSPSVARLFWGSATGWTTTSIPWANQRPRLVDLDGDGDRDIAFVPAALPTATTVLLVANTASGLAHIALPPGMDTASVQGVAIGDVDGNGVADLVVAVTTGSVVPSLVLLRGAPGPVYTLDLPSMPAGLPYGLWPELFDADGDGDLDVLATNASSGLRLLTNVGGTFVDGTASLPPTRLGHMRLAAGDYDGDGRDDCAAALFGTGEVDMLWGGPAGLSAVAIPAAGQNLHGLWPTDFDGDGDLDLLADRGNRLDMLWNQGLRQFVRREFAFGSVTTSVVARGTADVDRDGEADVLFATASDTRILRCRFSGEHEAGASAADLPPIGQDQMALSCAGDFDADGRTDLLSAQLSQFTVDRALGGGLYERSTRSTQQLSSWPASLLWQTVTADMDRDGDLDLVVSVDLQLAIADQGAAGTFAWTLQRPASNFGQDHLRVVDVDGDGDLDLVHCGPAGPELTRNLGGGQYAAAVVLVPFGGVAPCIELADVDGDTDLDLFAAAPGLRALLANDGAGNFAPNAAFQFQPFTDPTALRAVDVDGDGDQDLAYVYNSIRLMRNNGSGAFTETTASDLPLATLASTGNLVVADLDDDGDLDLASAQQLAPGVTLLVNDGTGHFSDRSAARVQPIAFNAFFQRLRAQDIDDDGDLDLVAGTIGAQHVLVNHVRQCRAATALRLGGVAELNLYSGPGLGQPGLAMVGVGFALASPPLPVPGLAGRLELDPTTLQVVAAVTTSPVGLSSVFVSVPSDPVLFGLDVWFQGAMQPAVGRPGFTNAVYEVVLR